MKRIVCVGAGQAGASLVARLRKQGFDGEINLYGKEAEPPYQRPPLSKAYLLGTLSKNRMFLRPERFYAAHDIQLHLGAEVEAIDPANQRIIVEGQQLHYDELVLATGAAPRRLPNALAAQLDGIHVIRTLDDIDGLKPLIRPRARGLIVGGGYIGLEAAAVCAKAGVAVTLIEQSSRILQRVASPETSAFFSDLHREHGVDIRENTRLTQLTGREGHVVSAELSTGEWLNLEFVIVGIGVDPGTHLAEAAGLEVDNGIATDPLGQCSVPHIWAAGDCASFPHGGRRIRLESVPNAIEQAEAVADNILGANAPYKCKPWFWSDQYDVKLQIAGLNNGYDRVLSRKGAGRMASFWYYRGDRLLAVDALNDPKAFVVGKRLIEAGGMGAKPDLVTDDSSDLTSLVKVR